MNLDQLFGHTVKKENPDRATLQLNDSLLNIPLKIFVIFSAVPNQDQMLVRPGLIRHTHNEPVKQSIVFSM